MKRAKPNPTGIFGRCNHDLDREGTRSSWEDERRKRALKQRYGINLMAYAPSAAKLFLSTNRL